MTASVRPGLAGAGLPQGFRVRLGTSTRRADGGRTLFGGSPARLLYLQPRARQVLGDEDEFAVADPTSAALARLLLDRGLADPVPDAGLDGVPVPADVTVVIPVRDRPMALAQLLAALPAGVHRIVVDDGSADARATAGVAARADARLLRHPDPRGPAAARNTGLAEVRTPLVAFLDSDVVPRTGWLAALLPHFADPAVGIVAPRIAARQTSSTPGVIARYEAARSSLDLGPQPALVAPRGCVAYLPSACLVGRAEAFAGGFDEGMHVAEDVDRIWRSIDAGWRARYEPAGAPGNANSSSAR